MHISNFLHTFRSSREGSAVDILESTDLASSSSPDILSKITSSLAKRDATSFAPAILS
jgi:hypothetical protein